AALRAAREVLKLSYCPYSKFAVGAALYTWDDEEEFITGTNFENASFGLTICAERAAIVRANVMGRRNFVGMAIVGEHADGRPTRKGTMPCGSCRQVINELSRISGVDLRVVVANTALKRVAR